MPIFGEYETVDEPIWLTEEPSYVSTIWKARRSAGPDSRLYVIKSFTARRRGTSTGEPPAPDTLDADLGLEFLETVKLLKRAQLDNPRVLAPIHHFGTTSAGAWYATDFYQRKSLREFIARQGGVETKALEHVVSSAVAGCLALQQTTGRSHGNLKASNVLLAGKPRPLRSTPLHLIDPQRTSALFGAGRATAHSSDPSAIRDAAELHDLRAVGELVLQLVEGRNIGSGYDYNYPIAPSPAWNSLGKDAERWRGLCNRLLSPQLSLAEINLEALAKEFRPNWLDGKRPHLWALGIGVAAIGAFLLFGRGGKQGRATVVDSGQTTTTQSGGLSPQAEAQARQGLEAAWQEARLAEQRQDWVAATNAWGRALAWAEQLQDPRRAELNTGIAYAERMEAAARLLRQSQFDRAKTQAVEALSVRPGDIRANDILAAAEGGARTADRERKRKELETAIATGLQAVKDREWARAVSSLTQAGQRAEELGIESQRRLATSNLEYARAMGEAERLLKARHYTGARAEANKALAQKPDSLVASSLLSQIEILRAKDQQEADLVKARQDLDRVVADGQQASRSANWASAVAAWEQAVRLADLVGDQNRRDSALKELLYAEAMDAGEKFFKADKPAEAAQEAAKALAHNPDGAAAKDLKRRADVEQARLAQLQEAERQRQELERLFASARDAALKADWAGATNWWSQAWRKADQLRNSPQRELAQRELHYAQFMETGERLFKAGKPAEAAEEAAKALARNPDGAAAKDLQKRAEAEQLRLAQLQEAERQRQELERLVVAGRDASQKADWPAATNQWGQAWRKAEQLGDPSQREAARRELEYAQFMDAGERLFDAGKPVEAGQEAAKALARNPDGTAAKGLKRRAEAEQTRLAQAQEAERQRQELDRLLAAGREATQKSDWAAATNHWGQAWRKAEQLREPAQRDAARKELEFAQAMDAGVRLLKLGKPKEAAQEAAKALARNPDSAAAKDLKSRAEAEQLRLALIQEAERQKRELDRLVTAGRDATQKGDWIGATNRWGEAWRKAQELQDPVQQQTSRSELDFAETMAEGERLLAAGEVDRAKSQAQRALSLRPGHSAAQRLQTLAESSGRQAQDYALAEAALRDGKYDEVDRLASAHPGVEHFNTLKRQAEEEARALQDANRRYASGDYSFVPAVQNQSYANKPAFASLVRAGQTEAEQLQALRAVRQANDARRLQEQITQLPRELGSKPPFAELATWAARQLTPVVSPTPPDPAAAAREAVAVHDRLLDHWEVVFGVKRGPRDVKVLRASSLSSEMRTFCLNQLDRMEEDYQTAGRLPDRNLKYRLDAVRRALGGVAVAPPPFLGPKIEPFIAPVRPR